MPRRAIVRSARKWDRTVTFVTSEAQWLEVASLAEHRDVSISSIMRKALTEYLKVNSPGIDTTLDYIEQEQQERARIAGRTRMMEAGEFTPLNVIQDHINTAPDHNGRLKLDTCEECRSFRL
jgi:predicted transcriptional regulator